MKKKLLLSKCLDDFFKSVKFILRNLICIKYIFALILFNNFTAKSGERTFYSNISILSIKVMWIKLVLTHFNTKQQ